MSSKNTIIVEEFYPVDPATLWNAISDHKEMIEWFFDMIPEFEAEEGFTTRFVVQNEGRIFTHLWKVTELVPGSRLVLDWRYEEYPGSGQVIFELGSWVEGSKLKLINHGLDSFPKDVPEFSRESCLGGWNYFLKNRLKSYLETKR